MSQDFLKNFEVKSFKNYTIIPPNKATWFQVRKAQQFVVSMEEYHIEEDGEDYTVLGADDTYYWFSEDELHLFCFFYRDECVGYSSIIDCRDKESGGFLLDCIEIDPDHQKSGLGSYFLSNWIFPVLDELNEYICTHYMSSSTQLSDWYTKLGFTKTATVSHAFQYGIKTNFMVRHPNKKGK
jgi:GNAT superfamily N-acetyltransferase